MFKLGDIVILRTFIGTLNTPQFTITNLFGKNSFWAKGKHQTVLFYSNEVVLFSKTKRRIG